MDFISTSLLLFQRAEDLLSKSPVAAAVLTGTIILLLSILFSISGSTKPGNIKTLSGIPLAHAWAFLTKRHDFVKSGLERYGNFFQFRMMQHNIIIMSGEKARQVFFGDRALDFTAGYQVLKGSAPTLREVKNAEKRQIKEGDMTWFQKRAVSLLRKDILAAGIPQMMADLQARMITWDPSGTFDPFDNIYNLVFQLTMRTVAAKEVADSPEAVSRVAHLYTAMEQGTTPTGMLFPLLPNAAKKQKEKAATEIYHIFSDLIDKRKTGQRENDALQALIDAGDSKADVVSFIMGSLFAGIVNTGNMAVWILLYLHTKPEWKARVLAEIHTFVATYASPSGLMATRLAKVSPDAWEDGLPVLEAVTRETIRLVIGSAVLLRRNMGGNMVVDGKTIVQGSFLVYPIASVHLNDAIYTDPLEFDPARYEPGREEDKKAHWAYLGWGVGRHPCLGMRFAKLEINMILTLFLSCFEYGLVDAAGKPTDVLPQQNRNNIAQARPLQPVRFTYSRIAD